MIQVNDFTFSFTLDSGMDLPIAHLALKYCTAPENWISSDLRQLARNLVSSLRSHFTGAFSTGSGRHRLQLALPLAYRYDQGIFFAPPL